MGGSRQASLRWTPARAQVFGSLHSSRRHLQPPSSIPGKWPRQLRLERLRGSLPHQDHVPRCGRVHPPLPAPRVALRIGPHSPLRLPRQSRPQTKTEAVPCSVFVCRSEEHTSELQSHVNLVCRLLLEKKG